MVCYLAIPSRNTMPGQGIAIGYDAKRAFFNRSGLGNFSRTLLNQLAQYQPDLDLHLFTPKLPEEPIFPGSELMNVHAPVRKKAGWRTIGMVRDLEDQSVDIYHGLSHELPKGIQRLGIPTVVSMHDVIFRRYPDHYPMVDRLTYESKWQHSCRRATMLVAISEATKRDLMTYYDVPEERVKVIYQSVARRFREVTTQTDHKAVREKYDLPEEYLLFVGSLTVRKNLLTVLKALSSLSRSTRPPLVVVGQGKSYQRQMGAFLHRSGLSEEVFFRPDMQDEDLPALYGGALALLYPSLYEGFGLPVVEGLSQGTPVITSHVSAMPEAAGPGGILVDPLNSSEIAAQIERLAGDSLLRESMAQQGQAYIAKFDPKVIAGKWAELYRSLLS